MDRTNVGLLEKEPHFFQGWNIFLNLRIDIRYLLENHPISYVNPPLPSEEKVARERGKTAGAKISRNYK